MTIQIDQAVAAIKAGDTKTGFEILRSFLSENPDSEKAWWVMSGLVPTEQRPHCLRQVLRINPNNQMARETLEELLASDVKSAEDQQIDKHQHTIQKSPPLTQEQVSPGFRFWLYTSGSQVHLILLSEESLILAVIPPKHLQQVKSLIKGGSVPKHLFQNEREIPLSQITGAKQEKSQLKLYYLDDLEGHVTVVDSGDASETNEILLALFDSLGNDFHLYPRSRKINQSLIVSGFLSLGAVVIAVYLYLSALRISAGQENLPGNIQFSILVNLLKALGPGGSAVIGGLLVLGTLGGSIFLLIKRTGITIISKEP